LGARRGQRFTVSRHGGLPCPLKLGDLGVMPGAGTYGTSLRFSSLSQIWLIPPPPLKYSATPTPLALTLSERVRIFHENPLLKALLPPYLVSFFPHWPYWRFNDREFDDFSVPSPLHLSLAYSSSIHLAFLRCDYSIPPRWRTKTLCWSRKNLPKSHFFPLSSIQP